MVKRHTRFSLIPSSTFAMTRFVPSAHSLPFLSIFSPSESITLVENSPAPSSAFFLVARLIGPSRTHSWICTTTSPTRPSARKAHAYGWAMYERNQMRLARLLGVRRRRKEERRETMRNRVGWEEAFRKERRFGCERVSCAGVDPMRSASQASRAAETPLRKTRYW